MQRIAQCLHNAGYKVHLIGRSLDASEPNFTQEFRTTHIQCKRKKGFAAYLEFNIRLFFFLIRKPFDILHLADPDTGIAGFKLKLFKRCKLVYDSHELFIHVPELHNQAFKKMLWYWVEKAVVKVSNARITVSESVGKELKRMHGRAFEIVRNVPLLEKERKEERFDLHKPFILYQGAVNKGRGLFELVLAAKDLPYHIYIAGRGDEYDNLIELVKKLNLYEKVHFLGYVKPPILRVLTQEAHLGYNLIESKSKSYFYSLSNKFFDYVHAGVPSLSPQFPEYQSLTAKHPVSVLCDLNAQTIIQTVKSIDETKYKSMQHACAQAKLEWNWEKESQILLNLYTQL
jgi:glycosyltransferase involved in cell wall biosynthesis